jgi:hypothetical protein
MSRNQDDIPGYVVPLHDERETDKLKKGLRTLSDKQLETELQRLESEKELFDVVDRQAIVDQAHLLQGEIAKLSSADFRRRSTDIKPPQGIPHLAYKFGSKTVYLTAASIKAGKSADNASKEMKKLDESIETEFNKYSVNKRVHDSIVGREQQLNILNGEKVKRVNERAAAKMMNVSAPPVGGFEQKESVIAEKAASYGREVLIDISAEEEPGDLSPYVRIKVSPEERFMRFITEASLKSEIAVRKHPKIVAELRSEFNKLMISLNNDAAKPPSRVLARSNPLDPNLRTVAAPPAGSSTAPARTPGLTVTPKTRETVNPVKPSMRNT